MGNIAFNLETLAKFDGVREQLFKLVQPGTPVDSSALLDVFTEFAEQLDKVFAALGKVRPAQEVAQAKSEEVESETIDVDYALDYKRFVLQVANDLHVAEQKQIHACEKAYEKAKEHVEESVEEAFEALGIIDDDVRDAFISDAMDAFNRM